MGKFYEEIVLMEQKFIKDDTQSIQDLLQSVVSEVRESIQIARFARYELGADNADNEEEE
jgi:elongation factor Ts